MSAASIRRARPDEDVPLTALMARLFVASYGHSADADNVAAFVAKNYGRAQQTRELTDPRFRTYVLEHDGEWAGYAQLKIPSPAPVALDAAAPAEVHRFYLDPRWHGRGLARPLMDTLEHEARAGGADALWLYVWQQAPQAIRFYEKCGFRVVGTSVFMVGAHATDDWTMARPLA